MKYKSEILIFILILIYILLVAVAIDNFKRYSKAKTVFSSFYKTGV